MRRLGLASVATAAVVVILGFTSSSPSRAVAQNGDATTPPALATQPLVVAKAVTARALAAPFESSQLGLSLSNANHANQIFTLTPQWQVSLLAGNGETGSLGDGGMATNAQLDLEMDSPVERSGIAIAPDGGIFIADTRNSTLRRISPPQSSEPGVIRSVAGRWSSPQSVSLVEPLGLAVDAAGDLFIADRSADAVVELSAATGRLQLLAQVVKPTSIAVDRGGSRLFIASADTGKIVSFDTETHSLATAITSLGGSQTQGVPAGLALDGAGNLFISAANLNSIYRLDHAAGAAPAVAFSNLHSPGDIAFDSEGNLFASDQGSQRVLEFVGAGVPTGVTLTPGTFNFGDEPTGGTAPFEQFTFANNSNAAVTGISIGYQGGNTGDFQTNSTSCLTSLAANSSCTINVAFIPTASGARSSSLTVANSVTAQQASLSGTGDDFELALQPSQINTLTVAAGNSVTFNLQATNDTVFMGTVVFECPGNTPPATQCTFNPTSATFNAPSQTIPFTITFQTTSRTKVPGTEVPPVGNSPRGPLGPIPFPLVGAVAFLAALYGAVRSYRARSPAAVLALSLVAVGVLLAGCHHKGLTINGTPAGTTNMIVQGTAQNATRGVQLQLVVQ